MNKKLWKIFNILFIITFFIITIGTIFDNKAVIKKAEPLPLIIWSLIILIVWFLLFKLFNKKEVSNKKEKILFFSILGIIFIIQLFFGYQLITTPSNWDFGSIFDGAYAVVNNGKLNNHYFSMCDNNIFPVLFLTLIFKIISLLGIHHYTITGIILNIVMIDLAIVCLYFIVRKLFNKNIALFSLSLCLFITPIFTYVPIFYTDTLSMVFPLLLILIYLYIKDINKFNKKKIILSILLAIISFLSLKMKATTCIVLVVILIDIILSKKYNNLLCILACLVFCLLSNILYIKSVNSLNIFNFDISEKKGFPMTHYFMMGLSSREFGYQNVNGIFNQDEVNNTLSITDYKEREEFNKKVIKERLSNYGIIGTTYFMYKKTLHNFGDGSYYAPRKLIINPKNSNNLLKDFVYEDGKYFDIYYYFSNGVQVSILLLMLLGSIFYLIDDKYSDINIFRLSVFGIFCFLLLWESRSRYLVNYILVMLVCVIPSINYIENKLKMVK